MQWDLPVLLARRGASIFSLFFFFFFFFALFLFWREE